MKRITKLGWKSLKLSALAFGAHLVYHQFIDVKIQLIASDSSRTKDLVEPISSILDNNYKPTVYLPFRFMEILYGNLFQKPDKTCYSREILNLKDGEHIALGLFTRLDQSNSTTGRHSHCDHYPRINRRQFGRLLDVVSAAIKQRYSQKMAFIQLCSIHVGLKFPNKQSTFSTSHTPFSI